MYNPTFESIYSIVPSVPALLLLLIPAILMTVSIVREKELGSMINFYVTPTGRLEYLIGKQLPYIAIGMINFVILTALALIVFRVPIKGSFLMLTLCTLLYVTATTGIGMVTSTFTSSQVAAVFVTAILTIVPTIQFSGLLQPVSTLRAAPASSARSGRPPTTCTPAWAPTRRASAPVMMQGHPVPRRLHPGPPRDQLAGPEETRAVAVKTLLNILWLGLKEIRSLMSDEVMVLFVVYAFTLAIYIAGDGHLQRGQQRVDRVRRRGRLGAVEGALQRVLPAALQVSRA